MPDGMFDGTLHGMFDGMPDGTFDKMFGGMCRFENPFAYAANCEPIASFFFVRDGWIQSVCPHTALPRPVGTETYATTTNEPTNLVMHNSR